MAALFWWFLMKKQTTTTTMSMMITMADFSPSSSDEARVRALVPGRELKGHLIKMCRRRRRGRCLSLPETGGLSFRVLGSFPLPRASDDENVQMKILSREGQICKRRRPSFASIPLLVVHRGSRFIQVNFHGNSLASFQLGPLGPPAQKLVVYQISREWHSGDQSPDGCCCCCCCCVCWPGEVGTSTSNKEAN